MGSTSQDDSSVSRLFAEMRAGDRAAGEKLWQAYLPRLLALARRTLGSRASGFIDAEDAVQSAFASFWRRTERGEFPADIDRNELWRLLAVFTRRRALRHVQREETAKRGGGHVRNASAVVDPEGRPLRLEEHQALAVMPTVDFDLHAVELLMQLDDDLRCIAILRLMGHTNREIAEILNRLERTVERKFAVIRKSWEQLYPGGEER